MENTLITLIATVISMLAMGGVTIYLTRRAGTADYQVQARIATTETMNAQRERIELLEEKTRELLARVTELEAERARDKKEINRLRKLIVDKAIADQGVT